MHAIAVIPARFGSTRFPGKMLAAETGRPLILHVLDQVRRARRVTRVIVATDDQRIAAVVRGAGGEALLTRADHPNGTSRIAEVAATIEDSPHDSLIINVQGDEPEIDPALIDRLVELLHARPDCPMATLASPITDEDDAANPHIVKVVCRHDGTALYFSRSRIPFDRDGAGTPDSKALRHIGLYGYRREFLARYVTLSETPLERSEKLEQLRALEHGHAIAVGLVDATVHGIDTPEQYAAFVARFRAR